MPSHPAESSSPVRIAQFGLGPIGVESVRLAATRPWAKIVGGVDIDPAKVGKTLGELLGDPALHHAKVYESFDALCDALGEEAPQIVLHTAGSSAKASLEQMAPMIRRGVHVASTCEQLLFPALRAPEEAREAHRLCLEHHARVVGTGVNPGFVMDVVPVQAMAVSHQVDGVHVKRVVDASTRRQPLQKKVGSGMAPAEFQSLFEQGKAGHAGFKESAALICHAMGWPTSDLRERLEPVVADAVIQTDHFRVEPGQVRGLHQTCEAWDGDIKRVDLDLTMALAEPEPHDRVVIHGDPPLDLLFQGGVPGDTATVAALLSAAVRLPACAPGLLLMTDLPAPRFTPPAM
ncbi:MAG: dihydrodipicolinate reductase [Planctomycetota bacterium]